MRTISARDLCQEGRPTTLKIGKRPSTVSSIDSTVGANTVTESAIGGSTAHYRRECNEVPNDPLQEGDDGGKNDAGLNLHEKVGQ